MAKRTHVTAVGWVDSDEFAEIGAGRSEGWLGDSSLMAAIQSPTLFLPTDPDSSSAGRSFRIRPALSPSEGDITAVEWIAVDEFLVLALGTSGGTSSSTPRKIVHPGRVLRLRFREIESQPSSGYSSHELCVVVPGAIARFDGSDIKSLLQKWFDGTRQHAWESRILKEDGRADSYGRIPYQLWNVSKFGLCADAAITGMMPPPLLELPSQERYYCAVTIGDDAVIAAYRLSEDRSRSLVGAILSKIVPTAFSTLSSLSNIFWRREQGSTKKPEETVQPFAKASHLTCLKDHPRKGEKLTLSPSGTLAAITDSLGRILLLDTQALVVVRLWKGYRDACCLFMEASVGRDEGSSSSSWHDETKRDHCLCLAIHAPKKGIIEIWKMRTGPRLLTIQCPRGSKILQPSARSGSSSSAYSPLEVFLWNGDSGQLSLLNGYIT
ncbi:unnamed protein product [Spirodela intermedia]|uniref:Rab3-GAP regulatory subunit N-terminal domain-containing protein n=1 Tax=Spirodela intermedia TaxID=51605 RepID=A0A7I8J6F1_SPIIN|nr:unnamed protein product [Spirodela intermedia]CAA6665629.1 unnamed protein product [Spirodela intermedia]